MMNKRAYSLTFSLFVAACGESSGDDGASSNGASTSSAEGESASSDSDTMPGATDEMLQRSLLSVGNNLRTKAFLQKVANGEEVTVAYIGGSITEGYTTTPTNSYVVGSYEALKTRLASGDGSHVHYVNAGMGGTPSTLGMIRYERDVLAQAPLPPDLVFVEFAVNDGDDPTNGASYESLVRRILLSENNPAVVLIFSVFRSHWNLEDRLRPVGEHYQLPMISIKQAVVPEFEAGTLTEDDFFRDDYHPNQYGFQIMTDAVTHFFTTVNAMPAETVDIEIPATAVIGDQFTEIKMVAPSTEMIPGEVEIDVGSFSDVDPRTRTYEYSFGQKKMFPENWHKSDAETNDPFVADITCKNLALVYKRAQTAGFGTAEVYVDGDLVETVEGRPSGAYDNAWTIILVDEDEAAPHHLEIRMAEESAAEKFTILALGYTQ